MIKSGAQQGLENLLNDLLVTEGDVLIVEGEQENALYVQILYDIAQRKGIPGIFSVNGIQGLNPKLSLKDIGMEGFSNLVDEGFAKYIYISAQDGMDMGTCELLQSAIEKGSLFAHVGGINANALAMINPDDNINDMIKSIAQSVSNEDRWVIKQGNNQMRISTGDTPSYANIGYDPSESGLITYPSGFIFQPTFQTGTGLIEVTRPFDTKFPPTIAPVHLRFTEEGVEVLGKMDLVKVPKTYFPTFDLLGVSIGLDPRYEEPDNSIASARPAKGIVFRIGDRSMPFNPLEFYASVDSIRAGSVQIMDKGRYVHPSMSNL